MVCHWPQALPLGRQAVGDGQVGIESALYSISISLSAACSGNRQGFTWQDYRDLIIATHHNLSAPLIWCWDNLNIHLAPELADFARENKAWLRVYRLPSYAPDLNPAEGIWSLLKRAMVNFAAADLDGLVRIIKRKLKKIQYRPHLIDGCLAGTGLTPEPW